MNWNDLFAALALVLVIEGLMPFMNPKAYKSTMMQMAAFPEKSIRMIGFGSMMAGLLFLFLVRG
jgi:uncharacterized protein YjeT (DUF2065 family)